MGSVALSLRASLEYLAAGFGFFGVTGFGSSFLGSSFFGVCFVEVLVVVLVGVLVGVADLASALVFCRKVSNSEKQRYEFGMYYLGSLGLLFDLTLGRAFRRHPGGRFDQQW